jgi:hypothetical protein
MRRLQSATDSFAGTRKRIPSPRWKRHRGLSAFLAFWLLALAGAVGVPADAPAQDNSSVDTRLP